MAQKDAVMFWLWRLQASQSGTVGRMLISKGQEFPMCKRVWARGDAVTAIVIQLVLMYTGGLPRAPLHQIGAHVNKWLDGFLPSKKRKTEPLLLFLVWGCPGQLCSQVRLHENKMHHSQLSLRPAGSQSPSVNCEHWVGSLLREEGRMLEGEGCLRGHESSSP